MVLEQKLNIKTPSILTPIHSATFYDRKVQCLLKRDDLIHPVISGNKWRKLKYQLLSHRASNKNCIISFGGAWSNHLHALGYCCKQLDIQLQVYIRGEVSKKPSKMIQDLLQWGVKVHYLDRAQYRLKDTAQFLKQMELAFPTATIIPEGGSHLLAIKGVVEMVSELPHDVDYFCMAVGSGGTIAGSLVGLKGNCKIIGIPVVNAYEDIQQRIRTLLAYENKDPKQIQNIMDKMDLIDGFHRGGYAKVDIELAEFIKLFHTQNNVILEPIYTGKLCLAITHLAQQGYFKPHQKIVILHSGGLQGLRGMNKFELDSWYQSMVN